MQQAIRSDDIFRQCVDIPRVLEHFDAGRQAHVAGGRALVRVQAARTAVLQREAQRFALGGAGCISQGDTIARQLVAEAVIIFPLQSKILFGPSPPVRQPG